MSSRTASVTPLALLLAALLAACSLDTAAAVPPILPGVGGGVDHLPDSGAATADASSAMEEDSAAEPPPTVLDDDALFALRTLADQPLPDVVRIDRTTGRTEVLFRSGPEASSGASIAVDETSVYVPTITHATPSHDQHAILVIDRVTGVEFDRFALPAPIRTLHRSHEGELYVVMQGTGGLVVHRLSIAERRLGPPVAVDAQWTDESVIAGDILVISDGAELASFDLSNGRRTHYDWIAWAGALTGSSDGRVVELDEGFGETELYIVDARTGDADKQATLPDGLAAEGFIDGETLWLIVRVGGERVLVAYETRTGVLASRVTLSEEGRYRSLRGSAL